MTTSPSTRTAPHRPARAWARERVLVDRARTAGPATAAALRRDALAALATARADRAAASDAAASVTAHARVRLAESAIAAVDDRRGGETAQ